MKRMKQEIGGRRPDRQLAFGDSERARGHLTGARIDGPLVRIWTDGACDPNPGAAAWAWIRETHGQAAVEASASMGEATNNRAEIMAAIMGLEALGASPARVRLTTDSEYLRNGASVWMANWKRRSWITKKKTLVLNVDLWQRLDEAMRPHWVEWVWVRGHAGQAQNERCDALASAAIVPLAPKLDDMSFSRWHSP